MESMGTDRKGGRLFRSRFLESLTRIEPPAAFRFYPGVAVLLIFLNYYHEAIGTMTFVPVFILGVLTWTFLEYLIHRFLFHIPEMGPLTKNFRYTVHGVHHAYPRDRERLVMPPLPWFMTALGLFLFFYYLMGPYVYAFHAGLVTGYLGYVYIHYRIHTSNVPQILKRQYRHHLLHHYKYEDKAFGVSSPLWDLIFGTMPPKTDDQKKDLKVQGVAEN